MTFETFCNSSRTRWIALAVAIAAASASASADAATPAKAPRFDTGVVSKLWCPGWAHATSVPPR